MTEPPIVYKTGMPAGSKQAIMIVVLLASLLAAPYVSADIGVVRVFYYGDVGSFYLGKRHAASWHQETPDGWPEVVDLARYGIATSDWSIPFGTIICFRVTAFPKWAEDEYVSSIGNTACGVVVDRMSSWVHDELGASFDIWPAFFQQLAGPDWQRIGTLTARHWVYKRSLPLLLPRRDTVVDKRKKSGRCIDCGTAIRWTSKRCRSCDN